MNSLLLSKITLIPGLPGSKKAKFGHKQFQKGQILKKEKRTNKNVKITKLIFKIS